MEHVDQTQLFRAHTMWGLAWVMVEPSLPWVLLILIGGCYFADAVRPAWAVLVHKRRPAQ